MNRIVLRHYPASRLPDDMLGDIDAAELVKIVVVVEEAPGKREKAVEDLRALLAKARASAPPVSPEEATARVRAPRDEWED
jgi:hypothetical protein